MKNGLGHEWEGRGMNRAVDARIGSGCAWQGWTPDAAVAGIPATLMGVAMLLGVRVLGPLLITTGALLSGDEIGPVLLSGWARWTVLHQFLCLIGGFLWLAATVSYARRSGDACLDCGRRDGPEGWMSPSNAKRWGRIAVYMALIVPVFYAVTRYAWALGMPLGISEEDLRTGQEIGRWTSGLFLANFGLVGGVLMLGLLQRWGEVFPRWMIGLAGRRVPIALAVVPASIVSVLLIVGGISILSSYDQTAVNAAATGENIWIVVGPTLLFPLWGAALAVATLGYYFRRRGLCSVCGRGAPGTGGVPSATHKQSCEHLPVSG
jgi:hypothetical protein